MGIIFYNNNILKMEGQIGENKNTMMNILNSIILPHIYNRFETVYTCSVNFFEEYKKMMETNKNVKKTTQQEIFIRFLNGIETLTDVEMEQEYSKIKTNANVLYLDEIIDGVRKSYFEFFTFGNADNKYNYTSINPATFLKSCYLEIAKCIKNMPDIFVKKHKPHDIIELIKNYVNLATIKSVATKEMFEEYNKKSKLKEEMQHKEQDDTTKKMLNLYNPKNVVEQQNPIQKQSPKQELFVPTENILNQNNDAVFENDAIKSLCDSFDNMVMQKTPEGDEKKQLTVSFLDNSIFEDKPSKMKGGESIGFPTYHSPQNSINKIMVDMGDDMAIDDTDI